MTTLWVGTYPAAGLGAPVGHGEGVWRLSLQPGRLDHAIQVTTQAAPSFVARHPALPVLYAVEEAEPTALSVLAVGADEAAHEVARVELVGAYGCHVLVAPDASALYVCNYGTGELVVLRLTREGFPLSDRPQQIWTHAGSGPRTDRQESSHAHSACMSPDGTRVLVADLGTDEIRRYRVGEGGLLSDEGIAATLPAGSGPRHMAIRGELLYVVCELDHRLRTLRWDRQSATAEVIAEQPTTLAPQRTGDTTCDAHVALVAGRNGDVLLVSVRGADVISVFDVAPEGELSYRCAFDVGHWPRYFAVVDESVVVAVERGHEVRAYGLDSVLALSPESESGAVATLDYAAAQVTSPACVVAL
ncbi:lactonase family protein [Demequina lutea]|uniref:6-phosphogluconolactonase (Cycloisomerase 2 family) n=1 Tax=Demequina lutea TaxID=431489 RepID=A0A7Z0CGK0_9MICO|nr:beta-propeller fold lactonase family protein [Demequina lutea]NYI40486.1 6-phosphogluconolactonase (cycloisomerase 2 family) [Demequina lutea]